MKAVCYNVELIIKNLEIDYVRCECTAGASGDCSHVAVAIHTFSSLCVKPTTDYACTWRSAKPLNAIAQEQYRLPLAQALEKQNHKTAHAVSTTTKQTNVLIDDMRTLFHNARRTRGATAAPSPYLYDIDVMRNKKKNKVDLS
jgi:hypothetical protein